MRIRSLLIILILFFLNASAWAIPGFINFQGLLCDSSGVPISGLYNMKFSIYRGKAITAGWNEEQENVRVAEGIFNIQLGSNKGFPQDLFESDELYLEIAIYNAGSGLYEILSPRKRLASTSFAMKAGIAEVAADAYTLNGFDSADFSQTGHTHPFSHITGTVSDEQIPDSITIDYAVKAGDASTVGGRDVSDFLDISINDQTKSGGLNIKGNVGIGVTNPNNKIQVDGLINFDSQLFSTFLGYEAGKVNNAKYNTFVGYKAGNLNSSGCSNTANGYCALFANTSGCYNTAYGIFTLYYNTTGYYNTANGYCALASNTTGYYNSACGYYALRFNSTGNSNTAFGYQAGYYNQTGTGNVFLGYKAGYYETESQKLYIANSSEGALIYGDFNTAEVGINTIKPDYNLHVNGSFAAKSVSFDIPDPRYNNENKRLIHSSLKGPENAVFYRGESSLINGEIIIELPDYFEFLTRKEGRTVQLTAKNGWSPLYVNGEVEDGKFMVKTTEDGKGNQEFYWELKAIRADLDILQVEVTKEE